MLFLLVLAVSLVVSSLFGHFIHWAIHQRWSGVFYRSHMEHHLELYPPGNLLSGVYKKAKWYHRGIFLFTPAFLVILGTAGGLMWWAGAPIWMLVTFGATMLGFGLLNDFVHDSTHIWNHWLGMFKWFKRARRAHFAHHRNMKKNFGIFYFGWDKLFGTYREE